MKHSIPNFVGNRPIEVSASQHGSCGPLVSIKQDAGAMMFQHSMTPAQAIAMADALLAAAASLMPTIEITEQAEVAL